ncbi:MAG: AAA family ATPase [Candidatus Yanofskybacteria bacterium]|nr:AAA family ATPase [Candidatus Yanofskybacteria bacterium]
MSIIGFDKQKNYFKQILKTGTLAHAYLFTGPDMTGKKQFALELFSQANNRDFKAADPDFKIIAPRVEEEETKIYIEDIRELRNFLSFKPLPGPYKFVIIDDADRLTEDAANAFLKMLEEPFAMTVLILITSQPRQLPLTIISRCQEVRFLPHKSALVEEFLSDKKLSADDKRFLTEMSGGRLGWVVKTLENAQQDKIQKAVQEFRTVARQGVFEKLQYAKKIFEKEDYATLVDLWIRWIRAYGNDRDKTKKVLRNLLELHRLISQPQYNHRLALENFLISL